MEGILKTMDVKGRIVDERGQTSAFYDEYN